MRLRRLSAAHAAGLVHRDFKPDNVLIDATGAKVTDFGLARAAAGSDGLARPQLDLAQTGSLVGTPVYMAPEQHTGGVIDARADQFALAIVAWEAIWGERPFRGSSFEELGANKATACFEAGNSPGGTVILRVAIDGQGNATSVGIDRSELRGPEVSHCVAAVLMTARWPATGSPLTFTYPLSFEWRDPASHGSG